MTIIGSIGIGLFILIILWIIALILFVISVRNQSNFGWFIIGITLTITAILITIPTEKQEQPLEYFLVTEKDYNFIYHTLLLAFVVLSALVGFFAFFIVQCIEPVRAKTIKTF